MDSNIGATAGASVTSLKDLIADLFGPGGTRIMVVGQDVRQGSGAARKFTVEDASNILLREPRNQKLYLPCIFRRAVGVEECVIGIVREIGSDNMITVGLPSLLTTAGEPTIQRISVAELHDRIAAIVATPTLRSAVSFEEIPTIHPPAPHDAGASMSKKKRLGLAAAVGAAALGTGWVGWTLSRPARIGVSDTVTSAASAAAESISEALQKVRATIAPTATPSPLATTSLPAVAPSNLGDRWMAVDLALQGNVSTLIADMTPSGERHQLITFKYSIVPEFREQALQALVTLAKQGVLGGPRPYGPNDVVQKVFQSALFSGDAHFGVGPALAAGSAEENILAALRLRLSSLHLRPFFRLPAQDEIFIKRL